MVAANTEATEPRVPIG